MGMVRLATGRDAADVAFATIFGGVSSEQPIIKDFAVTDPFNEWEWPFHTSLALSTDELSTAPLNRC